jgi:Tfp pilus assembly protein FimT
MRKARGFTLIELFLVMGLMMILFGLSSAYYSRFLMQSTTDNVATQLREDLRKAQIYSMTGRQNTGWGVRYGGNVITLYAVGTSNFNETFSVIPSITIAGFTDIRFAKVTGLPSVTPTITISGNTGQQETLTVNSEGVVTSQ